MNEHSNPSGSIVISIQSSVAYGHAGNSAAVFPMQRFGIEVWPVHTVQLSNHTGYPDWGGGALGSEHVADILAGIERRGGFGQATAVLSGYVGTVELVQVVADAVDRMKARKPDVIFCCDPVIGNCNKGLFIDEKVGKAIASHLVPRADILTPNCFELAWLTGQTIDGIKTAHACADMLAESGPPTIVVTSVPTDTGIGTLARNEAGTWFVETPLLEVTANGAGDVFAAMLLARLINSEALAQATAHAAGSIFGILSLSDGGELPLIAAQREIVAPTHNFVAKRVS